MSAPPNFLDEHFLGVVRRDCLNPPARSIVVIKYAPNAALRHAGDPVLGIVGHRATNDTRFPGASYDDPLIRFVAYRNE